MDRVNNIFINDFIEQNRDTIKENMQYLSTLEDEVIIEVRGLTIDDASYKAKNPDAKYDLSIKKIENGISIPYFFTDLFEYIKSFMPKNIKKLDMPLYGIDASELKDFKKLETLITSGVFLKGFEYIAENTNIKNIEVPSSINVNSNNKDMVYSNDLLLYKDLEVRKKEEQKIENPKFDNLNNEKDFHLKVSLSSNNLDNVNSLLKKVDMSKYNEIVFIIPNGKIIVEKNGENQIKINGLTGELNDVINIYDLFINKGFKVSEVAFRLNYNDNNYKRHKVKYLDYDYTKLDEFSKKVNLNVEYDSFTSGPYEEFRGLVEAVKYYRQLITSYSLSPLEKLTYAYDIMKTFNYKESKDDKTDSRSPHRIISTGNIVCVGYTALLSEILNGLDENVESSNFDVTCYEEDDKTLRGYHSRSIVKIDDDKYNVHGFYALDPTWDSYQEQGQEVLGEDYDALSLYRCFMIPFTRYHEFFKHDSDLTFFNEDITSLNTNLTKENLEKTIDKLEDEKEEPKKIFSNVFNKSDFKESDEELLKSFDSRRLEFSEFLDLVRNVRVAEGYKGNLLGDEVKKVARINAGYFNVDIKDYEFEKR